MEKEKTNRPDFDKIEKIGKETNDNELLKSVERRRNDKTINKDE